MRTIDQAHQNSGLSKKLIRAAIRQLGDKGEELENTLTDIMNHGASGGFSGFTYTNESAKFFKRNKKDIVSHLKQQADDFGQSPLEMVKGFRCAGDEDEENIASVLYGRATSDDASLENCLAWYALEEVARAMVDE